MREDSWDEEEFEDEANDNESQTVACYHCGASIYEDADICNQCGNFQIASESPRTGHPAWILWTAILLVAIFLASTVLPALRLFMQD